MQNISKSKRGLIVILICTVLISLSQVLWKMGVDSDAQSFFHKLMNVYVILGGFFYFLAAGGLVAAFRDGELSVLYPVVSLSFVWVSIMSLLVLEESLSAMDCLGITSIVCGVSIISIKN